ncbi:HRSL1 enzyme, partial [Sylvietta virens]|nr:HRSL1 enzyme [Sylvietta virens]
RAPEMGQSNCHPQPGDLIMIYRPGYQHWALYVGDGYVIHLTSKPCAWWVLGCPKSPVSLYYKRPMVKKELLKEVVGEDKWRVNKKYDHSRTPLPVKEIIQRAEKCIAMEVEYDVITCNCEHFVTELRYGEAASDQVS